MMRGLKAEAVEAVITRAVFALEWCVVGGGKYFMEWWSGGRVEFRELCSRLRQSVASRRSSELMKAQQMAPRK